MNRIPWFSAHERPLSADLSTPDVMFVHLMHHEPRPPKQALSFFIMKLMRRRWIRDDVISGWMPTDDERELWPLFLTIEAEIVPNLADDTSPWFFVGKVEFPCLPSTAKYGVQKTQFET